MPQVVVQLLIHSTTRSLDPLDHSVFVTHFVQSREHGHAQFLHTNTEHGHAHKRHPRPVSPCLAGLYGRPSRAGRCTRICTKNTNPHHGSSHKGTCERRGQNRHGSSHKGTCERRGQNRHGSSHKGTCERRGQNRSGRANRKKTLENVDLGLSFWMIVMPQGVVQLLIHLITRSASRAEDPS